MEQYADVECKNFIKLQFGEFCITHTKKEQEALITL